MKWYKSLICIISLFLLATLWLYMLSMQFTKTDTAIHFPKNLDDLKTIAKTVKGHQEEQPFLVVLLFCSAYLYKQTFAIPGSMLMNVLAGALFGKWFAFPLVCLLTACGATSCYTVINLFGKQFLKRRFPDKIGSLKRRVEANQHRLFYFLLSARLFPMFPNWFLNMAAPIININVVPFFVTIFIGLMPSNFICVSTGEIISSISTLNDIYSTSTILTFIFIAIVAIVPAMLLNKANKNESATLEIPR